MLCSYTSPEVSDFLQSQHLFQFVQHVHFFSASLQGQRPSLRRAPFRVRQASKVAKQRQNGKPFCCSISLLALTYECIDDCRITHMSCMKCKSRVRTLTICLFCHQRLGGALKVLRWQWVLAYSCWYFRRLALLASMPLSGIWMHKSGILRQHSDCSTPRYHIQGFHKFKCFEAWKIHSMQFIFIPCREDEATPAVC